MNAKGFGNDTALHDAFVNGHPKIVKLLDHVAVVTPIHSRGQEAPLDVAASPEIAEFIKWVKAFATLDLLTIMVLRNQVHQD